jgi:predicted membrane protein
VAFAESTLIELHQPVTIALGRIFDMRGDYRAGRWMRDGRHRGHGGMVGGIILAGIGVLLLLQNLGLPYFDDMERFWPVILIVVGAVQGTRSVGMGGRIWSGAVFTAGLVFLANNFGFIHGDVWKFFWPGILILIGLGMLARTIDRQSYGGYDPQATAAQAQKFGEDLKNRIISDVHARIPPGSVNHISEWAIFGGTRRRVDSQDFQGGEAFAMFGGVEIDLRKAGSTREEILVEANAIFGGIEIRVPENWNVTVRGSGIFGGYEDETLDSRMAPDAKQPHLIVNGFAVFGGVNIKN